MRTIKYMYCTLLCFSVALLAGCNDDPEYTPGPQADNNSVSAYFPNDGEYKKEFMMNEEAYEFTVTVAREKTDKAVTIPIRVLKKDDALSISESVTFNAGEGTAELNIKYNATAPEAGSYTYELQIDDIYTNPYSMVNGYPLAKGQMEIIDYETIALNVKFTPGKYSGSNKPPFLPFYGDILWSKALEMYTIRNFLNSGYDFNFLLDEDGNVLPNPDEGVHDTKQNRWYFYSGNEEKEQYRIPCRIPCEEGSKEDYITYIYFYTSKAASSYYNFNIKLNEKKGDMMGYGRFKNASSGRINFELSWD